MEGEQRQNLAAPCGLYCGACVIYRANKRGDSEFLKQIAEAFSGKEGQLAPGMPPLRKGCDVSEAQRQMQDVKGTACEGCLSEIVAFPCRICAFRDCVLEKGLTNCSQCPDSPCQPLVDFNNDGLPHHGEVLANIQRQRDVGIGAWIAEQEARWRCPQCGSTIDWYASQCADCGVALSGTFSFQFPRAIGVRAQERGRERWPRPEQGRVTGAVRKPCGRSCRLPYSSFKLACVEANAGSTPERG